VSEYIVAFTAINPEDLDTVAHDRLAQASRDIPGTRPTGRVMVDPITRRIQASFVITVEQAMAEAARDGGRLAKEILLTARMPDARLVEMTVRMLEADTTA
jgi:hypothetical protein